MISPMSLRPARSCHPPLPVDMPPPPIFAPLIDPTSSKPIPWRARSLVYSTSCRLLQRLVRTRRRCSSAFRRASSKPWRASESQGPASQLVCTVCTRPFPDKLLRGTAPAGLLSFFFSLFFFLWLTFFFSSNLWEVGNDSTLTKMESTPAFFVGAQYARQLPPSRLEGSACSTLSADWVTRPMVILLTS